MPEKSKKPGHRSGKSPQDKPTAFELDFQTLSKAAMDAKSASDWEKAVALYSQSLKMIEKAPEGSLFHASKLDLMDGRAACYNRLSDLDSEKNDLEAMLSIAKDLADNSRQVMINIRLVDLIRRTGKPIEGLDIAEKALAMARQVANQKLEADCLNAICIIQSNLSNLALSLETGENALRLYRELDDRLGQSDCLRGLSFTLSRLGQSTKAQAYAEQALEIARLSGDREKVAFCFNAMGLTYTDYAKQRDYEEQALSIFDSMGSHAQAALTRNNLGLVNWSLGLYGRARDYLEQAVNYARLKFLKGNLSYYLDSLGRIYCSINEIDHSKRVYKEGLQISENINDPSLVAAYKTGLGRVALAEGKFQEACDYCLASSQILNEIESLEQVTPLAWLGAAYLGLRDITKACQVTGQAVSILSTTELGNIEYPPQEVWWWRYRALAAQPGKAGDLGGIFSEAWAALDKARVTMLDAIKTLSDEGLRRNYFNKVEINRLIIQEWVKNATRRGIPLTGLTDALTGKGDLPGTLKRLLEIGVRLNAERDPGLLPRFIMEEVVELSGAERAVLYLVDNTNQRRIAAESLIDADVDKRKAFLDEISPLLDEVCQNQAPALRFTHEGGPTIQQRSILCVPLVARSKLIGLVYMDLDGIYGRFSLQDLDLINVLANQAAVAIENAGWASTLEHRVEERTNDLQAANNTLSLRINELAIINSVGEAMAKQLDVDTITRLVGDKVRDIFQAETIAISLYDPQAGLISFPYTYDRGFITCDPLQFGTGLTSKIIQSRQPLVFGSGQEALKQGAISTPHLSETDLDTQSYMGVPIIVGEKVLGVVDVQSYKQNAFDDSSVRLLNTLSSSMGVAIENARLFQETNRLLEESRQRAAELATIDTVGQAATSELDLDALIVLIGDQVCQIFKADIVYIALFDRQSKMINFPYSYGEDNPPMPLGPGLTSKIIETGQPLLINQDIDTRRCSRRSAGTGASLIRWWGMV